VYFLTERGRKCLHNLFSIVGNCCCLVLILLTVAQGRHLRNIALHNRLYGAGEWACTAKISTLDCGYRVQAVHQHLLSLHKRSCGLITRLTSFHPRGPGLSAGGLEGTSRDICVVVQDASVGGSIGV
jgi:hypothetical protein